ncbi:MAG: hypothetical protein GC137_08335 [Alphaproteobacteria bacterium]|nr:hypothetical protein [Alphaproteobacteria bacterium]
MLDAKHLTLFLSVAGVLASVHLARAQESISVDAHILKPGEEIFISVMDEDKLTGQYRIGPSGAISMPMVGKVQVAGLNPGEAELFLENYLQDGYIWNPVVSVQPFQETGIYVLGAVNNPGHYKMPESSLSILKAVALAGGFKRNANQSQFEILRDSKDQSQIKEKITLNEQQNSTLKNGDLLIVKERFF